VLGASPQTVGIYPFRPPKGFAEWVGWLCANGSRGVAEGTVGFREPVEGISQQLGLPPATALSSRETLEVLQGQAVVARLCEAFPCITAFSRAECPDYRIDASKRSNSWKSAGRLRIDAVRIKQETELWVCTFETKFELPE
jgi:hypothetical protein